MNDADIARLQNAIQALELAVAEVRRELELNRVRHEQGLERYGRIEAKIAVLEVKSSLYGGIAGLTVTLAALLLKFFGG